MTTFQLIALVLAVIWLALVAAFRRRSNAVLVGGLLALGLYTLAALFLGRVTLGELGLGPPRSWLLTPGLALAGLVVTLAYSPLADRLAGRWFPEPPTLGSFRALRQSRANLVAGIIIAWVLGGLLEELIARGIVLQAVESWLSRWLNAPLAAGVAICLAALGAGLMHSYQGPRAMVIITQLSILFGILFVASGHNLWAVVLCHGLYDTIAFVRFATGKSGYA